MSKPGGATTERGEVEHLFEVAPGLPGPGPVGLVDHEKVGDLQESGLVGLHRVAPTGRDDNHGGVGGRRHLDLHLPDADGLDDDDGQSGRTQDPHGVGHGEGQAPRCPRVAMERMKTVGSSACCCMRIRSPKMAPPLKGEVGSMASTADLIERFGVRARPQPAAHGT